MKKSLIALAILSVSGYAVAQSAVSISGGLRIGIKSHNGNTAITPDQGSGNVINFNIAEDLGGGMRASARTQLRFDMSNGANNATTNTTAGLAGVRPAGDSNDRLFQVMHVGLGGGFGEVQLGRIGFNQLWGHNPFGSNGANVNISGTGGATEDGQFRYISPSIMGLKIELGGALKANTANANDKNSNALLVSYGAGPLSATFVTEKVASGVRMDGLGASYNAGFATLHAIWARDKNVNKTTAREGYSISGAVPLGAVTLKAGYRNMSGTTTSNADAPTGGGAAVGDKTSFGIDYALSKRTTAEANLYKAKGVKGNTWIGVRHSF
jgi:hypothetical protein